MVYFRDMLISGTWQSNMTYLTCDDYDGKNTPERAVDLKSYFVGITEPTSYGNFSLAKGTPFNGHSYMKFDMDISSVSILGGASVNTKNLGSWTAGLAANSPLKIVETEDIKNLTADVVYRVYTVVVILFKQKMLRTPSTN